MDKRSTLLDKIKIQVDNKKIKLSKATLDYDNYIQLGIKGLNKKIHMVDMRGGFTNDIALSISMDILDRANISINDINILTNDVIKYILDMSNVYRMIYRNKPGDFMSYNDRRYNIRAFGGNSYSIVIVIEVYDAVLEEYDQGHIKIDYDDFIKRVKMK
jgi:hypothetical protein